ncbi:N-acyl-D-amino-acid deacylase family protein [Actinoallomurus iriomotensis]|uniref:Aminoacylase n=1 Tax=Actinoallomurus iriomotensis TaxID=478107 RepID=A0A9W6RE31_9ACTN|nr:amidohydrolase family protein [Actinoallomurus iriomotensis]GLY73904.1 aminoacylase [Actinoallomurus iriomotensis]
MAILIRRGRVVDPDSGTDAVLDLLIDEERVISAAPRIAPPNGATVIDAAGLVVLPGFVDMHTHSDFTLQDDPAAEARLHQGITTDVTGNCGFSPFPLPAGCIGFGSFFNSRITHGWPDLDSYAAHLRRQRPTVNIAPLVGLGAVREHVLGPAPRPPDAAEAAAMRRLVEQALEQGAFGVSSGLVYTPGRYADAAEIRDVLAPVARAGRLYATHLRDERDGLVDSVAEAISTAEAAGVALQVSHHKALGRANWGRTRQTLSMIDEANRRGVSDVAVDYYPYTSGSTGVSSLLPDGSLDGGWTTLRERADESAERLRLLRHLESSAQFRPDEIIIGRSRTWPEASGRALQDLAGTDGRTEVEALLKLILDEGERLTMIVPAASEDDLAGVSAHPTAMHGSDGWLMTAARARYEHPRNLFSTIRVLAPALLGRTSIIQAVRRLATAPARRLSLTDRGALRPGSYADVVIADPARAARQPDNESAHSYPDLMRWVFVNGQAVIEDAKPTGRRPGQVLRAS